jgi:uncharacterized membrane protein YedE/YeeE
MTSFTPYSALIGGALIGLATAFLFLSLGRNAGISGIAGGITDLKKGDVQWRVLFVLGLVAGGAVTRFFRPEAADVTLPLALPGLLTAGFLVGFGARLGSGCTSGHGICGLARLSPRGLAATVCFMAAGGATVYVMRHLLGGRL